MFTAIAIGIALTLALASPEEQLGEAHAAFDALEMERAAAILEPLVASPGVSDEVRGRAWLALGLTRASLHDTDGARAAFTAALAIDASLAPPPGTSPKVAALFEKTRDALGIEMAPRSTSGSSSGSSSTSTSTSADSMASSSGSSSTSTSSRETGRPFSSEDALMQARMPWLTAGGALLVVGVVAGGAALAADASLAAPVAGRTRADYEGVRSAGIAALGTSAALLVSGGLVVGAAFSLVEAP